MKYFLSLFLISVVACTSTKNAKVETNETNKNEPIINEISGKQMLLNDIWALETVNFEAQKIIAREFQHRPVIELHLNDKKLMGNDGCNQIFGKIEALEANKITFGSIGGTKKYCAESMELSNAFRKALAATVNYKLANLKLYFFDAAGEEILIFRKVD